MDSNITTVTPANILQKFVVLSRDNSELVSGNGNGKMILRFVDGSTLATILYSNFHYNKTKTTKGQNVDYCQGKCIEMKLCENGQRCIMIHPDLTSNEYLVDVKKWDYSTFDNDIGKMGLIVDCGPYRTVDKVARIIRIVVSMCCQQMDENENDNDITIICTNQNVCQRALINVRTFYTGSRITTWSTYLTITENTKNVNVWLNEKFKSHSLSKILQNNGVTYPTCKDLKSVVQLLGLEKECGRVEQAGQIVDRVLEFCKCQVNLRPLYLKDHTIYDLDWKSEDGVNELWLTNSETEWTLKVLAPIEEDTFTAALISDYVKNPRRKCSDLRIRLYTNRYPDFIIDMLEERGFTATKTNGLDDNEFITYKCNISMKRKISKGGTKNDTD